MPLIIPPTPKFYYPLVLKGIISWFVSYNMWCCNRGSATSNQLTFLNFNQCKKKLINKNNRLLSGSKTTASLTCKLNFEKCNMFLICAQEKQLTLINFSLSKIQCSRSHVVPFNVITIQLTSLQTASTHQLTIITLNRYLGQYYSCVA